MCERDTGEVRRYSVEQMWREFPSDDMCIHARDHDAAVEADRERSDKRVEEREQGYAMEYEAFRLAHDEIVDGKDEQIATLKKAFDAVIESEEISDEAADDLEGENVRLRERVADLEGAAGALMKPCSLLPARDAAKEAGDE